MGLVLKLCKKKEGKKGCSIFFKHVETNGNAAHKAKTDCTGQ